MSDSFSFLIDFLGKVSLQMQKMMGALVLLVCIDYITGVCVAVRTQKLSSKIGAKGIATKVMIFAIVAVSAVVDRYLIGTDLMLSNATILFYCVNELISILENVAKSGLPLPKKLTDCLKNLHRDTQQENTSGQG